MWKVGLAAALLLQVAVASVERDIRFKPLDPEVTDPSKFWMPLENPVPQDFCTHPRYPVVPTEGPIAMDVLHQLYPNGTVPKAPPKPTNVWQKNLWGFEWDNTHLAGDWGAVYPYPYVVSPRTKLLGLMYPGEPVNFTGNTAMQQGVQRPNAPFGNPKIENASYPYMTMSAGFDVIVQVRNGDLLKLVNMTDVSATVEYRDKRQGNKTVATVYLVKGSPFVTIECDGAELAFGEEFAPAPPIIDVNGAIPGTVVSGEEFKFQVAQAPTRMVSQWWHAYFSSPVSIQLPDPPNSPLNVTAPFTGVVQLAVGEKDDKAAHFLAKAKGTYAKGVRVAYDMDDTKKQMTVRFEWDKVGKGPLALLGLAHHVRLLDKDTVRVKSPYWCVKGNMTAVVADKWELTYNVTDVGFGDTLQVDPTMKRAVADAALLDYKLRSKGCPGDNATYGYPGHMNMELYAYVRDLSQRVDIAIVLENLGYRAEAVDMTRNVLQCMSWVLKRPKAAPKPCPPPINNTATCVRDMMDIYYDTTWGGLITGWYDRFAAHYCQCDKPGGIDACKGLNYCDNPHGWDGFSNYGNSFYNDHVFQYGYIIKSLAWAVHLHDAKKVDIGLNATEVAAIKKQALAFARDVTNPSAEEDPYFTYNRHKDTYDGHSWAEGYDYSGRIVGWTNMQSGGEAVNSFYSVYLLGVALNDTNVKRWGQVQLATESFSVAQYQHLSNRTEDKVDQPTPLFNEWGKCLSILFGNKASGATYYGPNPLFQCGITVLPISPFTREWVDADWAEEAVGWMKWHNERAGECVFFDPNTMAQNPCPGNKPDSWTGNEWSCCPTNDGYPMNQWRAWPNWYPYLYALQSLSDPEAAWKALQVPNATATTKALPFPYLDSAGDVVGYQHDITMTAAFFHVATHSRKP